MLYYSLTLRIIFLLRKVSYIKEWQDRAKSEVMMMSV